MSFLAGIVPLPAFLTRAGQVHRIPSSRSVAVKVRPSPLASSSTLERIGMVAFRSTTPWDNPSSRTKSDRLTVNSIAIRLLPVQPLLARSSFLFLKKLVSHLLYRNRRRCGYVEFSLNYPNSSRFPLRHPLESA